MQAKSKMRKQARRVAISVNELAQGVGLSPWSIYQKIQAGAIPAVRIGTSVRIPLAKARELWPGVFDGEEWLIEEPEPNGTGEAAS